MRAVLFGHCGAVCAVPAAVPAVCAEHPQRERGNVREQADLKAQAGGEGLVAVQCSGEHLSSERSCRIFR